MLCLLWESMSGSQNNLSNFLTANPIVNGDLPNLTHLIQSNGTEDNFMLNTLWNVCFSINIFLLIICFWIALSFLLYGCSYRRTMREDQHNYSSKKVIAVALITPMFVLPRLACTFSLAFIGYYRSPENTILCEVMMDISIVAFGIGTTPTYVFLWLRQRVMYSQPFIKKLYTKRVKFLSWTLLGCMAVALVLSLVLYVAPHTYAGSPHGCKNTQNGLGNTPHYLAAAFQIMEQLLLLALYVYPLVVHKRKHEFRLRGSKRKAGNNVGKVVQDKVYGTMVRSLCCSIGCVLSDILAMLSVSMIIPKDLPRFLTNVVYDVSLVFNVFCVTLSFEAHKKILTSLCGLRHLLQWRSMYFVNVVSSPHQAQTPVTKTFVSKILESLIAIRLLTRRSMQKI